MITSYTGQQAIIKQAAVALADLLQDGQHLEATFTIDKKTYSLHFQQEPTPSD